MASDVLVRLLVDDKQYNKKIRGARQQLDHYVQNGQHLKMMAGGVASALTKIAGGIGLAMGAAEAFNKVLHSTQSLGDEFDNTLAAAKGTVDAFFQSIASGDWTTFNDGISTAIARFREVAELRDAFADAQLSMNFDTREFEKNFAKLEGIVDDETKSVAERQAAFAKMQEIIAEYKKKAEEVSQGTAEMLVKSLNARFGKKFNIDDIKKYISVYNYDTRFTSSEEAKRLADYKKKLAELQKKQYVDQTYPTSWGATTVRVENKDVTRQIEALKAANEELEKMRILNEDNDAERKKMVADYEYMNEILQRAGEYHKRSLEKQTKILNLQRGAIHSGTPTPTAGSIAEIDAQIKAAQEVYANTASDAARDAAWKTIQELQKKKITIEFYAKFTNNPGKMDGNSGAGLPTGLSEGATAALNTKIEQINPPIKSKDVKNVDKYVDGLNALANVMTAVNTSTAEGAAGWLTWAGNLMSATATAVASSKLITGAKTKEAGANAAASAAATPVVGWLMVGAAVASVLAAIASIPSYATGGIISGQNFQDGVTARVSSGEMIINEADQKRLFDSIHSGNLGGGGAARSVISGEQIVTVVNNYGKRIGRGELIR